jgi:hypothetical protein
VFFQQSFNHHITQKYKHSSPPRSPPLGALISWYEAAADYVLDATGGAIESAVGLYKLNPVCDSHGGGGPRRV